MSGTGGGKRASGGDSPPGPPEKKSKKEEKTTTTLIEPIRIGGVSSTVSRRDNMSNMVVNQRLNHEMSMHFVLYTYRKKWT